MLLVKRLCTRETLRRFFCDRNGRVEVVSQRPSGQNLVLQEMGAGEWFGEIGILLGKPRTATVRAASGSEAEVMVIGKEDFHHLMSESSATQAGVWLVLFGASRFWSRP